MSSIFEKLGDLFSTEDEDELEEQASFGVSDRREQRRGYGLTEDVTPVRQQPVRGGTGTYGREAVREPLGGLRADDNVIPMRGKNLVEKLTKGFKIVVSEPRSFDETPKLVDSLKGRKPIIINLENIENDTARKIFDFLSGATYALNGNVQKIAQNIFVFLPENVDVSTGAQEPGAFKYGEE
ncbi:MAG: cell division protein SepF [Clostridiales Family XIII bacterium]|jgi:FtsZ-interacting cell division protein YlmF|nr:cell division protein SepF [Clostridiales Family XIII bacterium]